MKRLMIAATAMALAAPAMAQQPVQNACEHFNQSREAGDMVNCDLQSSGISSEAAEILSRIGMEAMDGIAPTAQQIRDGDRGVVNAKAAEILQGIADEDDGGA